MAFLFASPCQSLPAPAEPDFNANGAGEWKRHPGRAGQGSISIQWCSARLGDRCQDPRVKLAAGTKVRGSWEKAQPLPSIAEPPLKEGTRAGSYRKQVAEPRPTRCVPSSGLPEPAAFLMLPLPLLADDSDYEEPWEDEVVAPVGDMADKVSLPF